MMNIKPDTKKRRLARYINLNRQINDFPRMCTRVQDRYASRHLQRVKDGMVLLTETQAKRVAAEILSVVEETDKKGDHKLVKELLYTYQNSSTDVWHINSTEGISLNKIYVIMYHTYFSPKKIAEESAKLLNEDWIDTLNVREFINSWAIALESQHLEAAKQHILAQLQKGLDVESYDILRREGLNRTAELNSKTTIATWAHSLCY